MTDSEKKPIPVGRLKGLLKGYWEDLDGTFEQRMTSSALRSQINRAAIECGINDDDAWTLEDAIAGEQS